MLYILLRKAYQLVYIGGNFQYSERLTQGIQLVKNIATTKTYFFPLLFLKVCMLLK
jgi:hypothetical protein